MSTCVGTFSLSQNTTKKELTMKKILVLYFFTFALLICRAGDNISAVTVGSEEGGPSWKSYYHGKQEILRFGKTGNGFTIEIDTGGVKIIQIDDNEDGVYETIIILKEETVLEVLKRNPTGEYQIESQLYIDKVNNVAEDIKKMIPRPSTGSDNSGGKGNEVDDSVPKPTATTLPSSPPPRSGTASSKPPSPVTTTTRDDSGATASPTATRSLMPLPTPATSTP